MRVNIYSQRKIQMYQERYKYARKDIKVQGKISIYVKSYKDVCLNIDCKQCPIIIFAQR